MLVKYKYSCKISKQFSVVGLPIKIKFQVARREIRVKYKIQAKKVTDFGLRVSSKI